MPLLATKLHLPPVRPNLISRPHLLNSITPVSDNRLILLSAPAGFGKTTLLSDWLATYPWPTSWLSLDRGDNDPVRFWTYIIAALQKIQPGLGESALALLCTAPASPMEPTQRLLQACSGSIRDTAIITLLLQTGIRLSELTRLTLQDINIPESGTGEVRIVSSGSRRGRVSPLNSKASQALKAYLQDRKASSSPHLFLDSRGKPLGGRGV